MEENKTESKSSLDNLYLVFIVLGIAALVAAYFLVTSPKISDINDMNDEVDSLKAEYTTLNQDYSTKAQKEKQIDELNDSTKDIYDNYDGDVTYQSVIGDIYNMDKELSSVTTAVAFSEPSVAYTFQNGNEGKLIPYTVVTSGTYDQMKKILEKLNGNDKKKVITAVTFKYDAVGETVTLNLGINEFAIKGLDADGETEKSIAKIDYPANDLGRLNIFYTQVVSQ